MANGENPQIVRAMLRWTNLNMLAHYAHGFKSDKLEAQGAVLDKLVKLRVECFMRYRIHELKSATLLAVVSTVSRKTAIKSSTIRTA